jgi:hypothetical protein
LTLPTSFLFSMLGGKKTMLRERWGPCKGGMGEQARLGMGSGAWEVTPMVLHESGMHGEGVVGR